MVGESTRYIFGSGGQNHYNWKGGKRTTDQGYIQVVCKGHHRAIGRDHNYVFEHILVYERYHKCCILPNAIIHHKNGVRYDNRIDNLECMTRSTHRKIHTLDMSDRRCSKCGSNETYISRKNNRPIWYVDKITRDWLCNKCGCMTYKIEMAYNTIYTI
jgi:predicted Zn-ribbon and HTH transcriptional regulator